jgi:hypothetical protein
MQVYRMTSGGRVFSTRISTEAWGSPRQQKLHDIYRRILEEDVNGHKALWMDTDDTYTTMRGFLEEVRLDEGVKVKDVLYLTKNAVVKWRPVPLSKITKRDRLLQGHLLEILVLQSGEGRVVAKKRRSHGHWSTSFCLCGKNGKKTALWKRVTQGLSDMRLSEGVQLDKHETRVVYASCIHAIERQLTERPDTIPPVVWKYIHAFMAYGCPGVADDTNKQ